jgi:hypothetical protein
MAEKIILEFRADDHEDGCGCGYGHGWDSFLAFGPAIMAFCTEMGVPGAPPAERPQQAHGRRDKARHDMRETLDFFERMYDDLFGGEASSESGASESS